MTRLITNQVTMSEKTGSKKTLQKQKKPVLRNYQCQYCDKTFDNTTDKRRHEMVHTGDKPYKCKHCEKSFNRVDNQRRHEMGHVKSTKGLPHSCAYCAKFDSTSTKRNNTDIDGNPNQCNFCDKIFARPCHRRKHEQYAHSEDKPYKCQFCSLRFVWESQKKKHEGSHSEKRAYLCQTCGKSFKNAFSLKHHEKTHSGERNHKCQFCGKAFLKMSDKEVHEKRHTGEKPLMCQYCGMCFTGAGSLKHHEMIHTGEKPHKCNFCEKRFITARNMRRHEMVHTGEKPHLCRVCDKGFITRRNRDSHEKVHSKMNRKDTRNVADVLSKFGVALPTPSMINAGGMIPYANISVPNHGGQHFAGEVFSKDAVVATTAVGLSPEKGHLQVDQQFIKDSGEIPIGKRLYLMDAWVGHTTERPGLIPGIKEQEGQQNIGGVLSKDVEIKTVSTERAGLVPRKGNAIPSQLEQQNIGAPLSQGSKDDIDIANISTKKENFVGDEETFLKKQENNVTIPTVSADDDNFNDYDVDDKNDDENDEDYKNDDDDDDDEDDEDYEDENDDDDKNDDEDNVLEDKVVQQNTATEGIKDPPIKSSVSTEGTNVVPHKKMPVEKLHQCQHCDKRFSTPFNKRRHEAGHEVSEGKTKQPHNCAYCAQFNKSQDSTSNSKEENPNQCKQCGKILARPCLRKKHELSHSDNKPYKCEMCSRGFMWRSQMKQHETSHLQQRSHSCNVCEKSFKNLHTLKEHEKTHSGERKHKCQFCEKAFLRLTDKNIHEKRHTGEKPLMCQYCGMCFIAAGDLKYHEMIHTGEKPHQCKYCDKRFISTNNKTRHEKIHSKRQSEHNDEESVVVEFNKPACNMALSNPSIRDASMLGPDERGSVSNWPFLYENDQAS